MAKRMLSPIRSQEEIERAAKKKGRAYWCLRCLHKGQKEFIVVKYRMEAHILQHHLEEGQVPYYCSLCQFRTNKESELEGHLHSTKRHASLARQKRVDPKDPSFPKRNPEPYVIGHKDYFMMSREDSMAYWVKSIQNKQTTIDPEPDSLSAAMMDILNEVYPVDSGCSVIRDASEVSAEAATSSQTEDDLSDVENIMRQLLPGEPAQLTTKRKTERGLIPNKKFRPISPESSSSSSTGWTEEPEEAVKERPVPDKLAESLDRQTLVLASLEKAITSFTQAITGLTKTLGEKRVLEDRSNKENRRDESRREESKRDENRRDESKRDENRRDESRRDERERYRKPFR